MRTIITFMAMAVYATPFVSSGQASDTMSVRKGLKGHISFVSFGKTSPDRRMSTGSEFLRKTFRSSEMDEFRLKEQTRDELGMDHATYQQYYMGLRVEGSVFKLHGKSNEIQIMNGTFEKLSFKNVKPSLPEASALAIALTYCGATKYAWEDESLENLLKANTKDPNATNYPKGELVITRTRSMVDWEMRIVWRFEITSVYPFNSQVVYVDASSGEVINAKSLICNDNSPGTAETRYNNDPKAITTDDTHNVGPGRFRLRELRNNVVIQTLNLYSQANLGAAVDFTDDDNYWSAAEHANAAQDQVALDAHWGAEKVFDYWKNVRGRNSIDGNGMGIMSYVHYGDNGAPYGNANWLEAYNVMIYGDGTGTPPLTVLDVCAHEFGHGICQYTANLDYEYEPGALNEGLSDIWGAVIEFWAAPEKQHWLIGEDLGTVVRSMIHPTDFGQPDTYHGPNYAEASNCVGPPVKDNDWCGVHKNSGVLNHWFYLLSDGGAGANGLGSCYDVLPIGITDAASIVYRAESYYLTNYSGFLDARDATTQAAIDLFGQNSAQKSSVITAWAAVGVGPASETIQGTVVCASGATVTLNTSIQNVNWVVSPSSLFVNSSGSGTSAYLQAKTSKVSGLATIVFTPVGNCSNSFTKQLWVGKPQNNITGPSSVYPDQIYNYYAADPYTSDFMWTLNPGVGDCGVTYGGNCFFGSGGGGQAFTIVWMHESGYVQLNSSNSCGFGPQKNFYVTVTTEGGCNPCQIMSFFPNPSRGTLNIRLNLNGKLEPTEVKLVDEHQITVYSKVVNDESVSIQTTDLHEGVYYLIVTNSSGTETRRVLVGKGN